MKLQDLTIKEFLEKTYGKDPVPGGGSVSALCGALAASLGEMVTALTIGRKKYVDVEEEMKIYAPKLENARNAFLDFIDKDADAYQKVFEAFKMPKETPADIETRTAAIQEATLEAALVPLSVAKKGVEIMPHIVEIGKKGNQNAVTDACVAVMCARTAVFGALLNVRINLSSLADKTKADELAKECDELQGMAQKLESALLNNIEL